MVKSPKSCVELEDDRASKNSEAASAFVLVCSLEAVLAESTIRVDSKPHSVVSLRICPNLFKSSTESMYSPTIVGVETCVVEMSVVNIHSV